MSLLLSEGSTSVSVQLRYSVQPAGFTPYTDHVSILKFIERNWGVSPVTHRSRDNFPNPIVHASNPYVPLNSPAIGDLFDLFDFDAD